MTPTTVGLFIFPRASFWQLLEKTLLPALIRPSGPRSLNVWSAACSTGQEAYSLSMLLAERFPPLLDGARITATDVAETCLEQGRSGIYRVMETNRGLSAARLVRHFEQCPQGFRVRPELRQRVTWQYANLLGALPYPRGFDLIMCRNVLIYFNEADRARVVAGLIKSLAPGGVLGLGSSEVVRGLTSLGPAGTPHAPKGAIVPNHRQCRAIVSQRHRNMVGMTFKSRRREIPAVAVRATRCCRSARARWWSIRPTTAAARSIGGRCFVWVAV